MAKGPCNRRCIAWSFAKSIENEAGYTAVRCVPRLPLCTRHILAPLPRPPHPSFLLLSPLNIPAISEAEITRFREFETKALRTDRRTDGPTDGRTLL